MSEQINETTTTTEQATTPLQSVAPITQPQAAPQTVNVDINAIAQIAEQKAEQKMQNVFKDMLKQQGFDSETVNAMAAEYKAKQVTPEQTIQELRQKVELSEQREAALLKGIPLSTDDETEKQKVNACLTLAKSYVSDDVPFAVALDKALEIISFKPKQEAPPPMYGGAGKQPIGTVSTEKEEKKRKYLGLK